MPIYEYRCNRCAETTEKVVTSYKDAPLKIPCKMLDCGGVAAKIFSRGAFAILDHVGDSVKMGS